MSLYQRHKTDPELEKNGVRIEYGQNSKGEPIFFLLARAGGANTLHDKRLEHVLKPYRRQIQTETMESAQLRTLIKQVFIETCVKGAGGLEDENDKPLEPTPENISKVLFDIPDILDDLMETASKGIVFRQVVREADAKN